MTDISWMEDAFQHLEEKRVKYDEETAKLISDIKKSNWQPSEYLKEILCELVRMRRREERP